MASGAVVPSIQFEFDFRRTKASILYLAAKGLPRFDKYQTCKLLFLADKAHLLRFGRTITGDSYDAWKYGPCPTKTKILLDGFQRLVQGEPSGMVETVETLDLASAIHLSEEKYPQYRPLCQADLDELSESDRLILDQVANEYGHMDFDQLYQLTHDLAAYVRVWQGESDEDHYRMRFEDFFAEAPDRAPILREIREEQQLRRLFLASVSA